MVIFKDEENQIQTKVNVWTRIFDFDKSKEDESSNDVKNFKLIEPKDFKMVDIREVAPQLKEVLKPAETNPWLFDREKEYGGTLEGLPEQAKLEAFDIKTGAQEAQKQFDKREEVKEEKANQGTVELDSIKIEEKPEPL